MQSPWIQFIFPILTSGVQKTVKTDLSENCAFKERRARLYNNDQSLQLTLILLWTAKETALIINYSMFSGWLNNPWLLNVKRRNDGVSERSWYCNRSFGVHIWLLLHLNKCDDVCFSSSQLSMGEKSSSLTRMSIRACCENDRMGERIISRKLTGPANRGVVMRGEAERRRRPTAHQMPEIDSNTELYETWSAYEATYAYSEIAVFFNHMYKKAAWELNVARWDCQKRLQSN